MRYRNHQLWPQIVLVGSVTFVVAFIALLNLTWSIGTKWEPLDVHFHFWMHATLRLILGDFNPWMLYWWELGNHQLDFVLRIAAPAVTALAVSFFLTRKLLYVPGGRDDCIHISGPELVKGRKAKHEAQRALRKSIQDGEPEGIYLHPMVRIPMKAESGNILVNAFQGGGKSVFMKAVVQQIQQRGDLMFIYDVKNEYTPLFLNKNSVLLNPTDQRGLPWIISEDISSEMDAELFAARLIPETSEPLWSNGARLLLTGCIVILIRRGKPWSWRELAGILTFPQKELKAMLTTHYPSAAIFIEENSKTTQGFFVTLISHLSWVRRLREYWPNSYSDGFSVSKWLAGDGQITTIIFGHDEQNSELSTALCNALFGILVSRVLALPDSDSRRVWFALDELASLPKTESLEKWLRLGRSKGARTVAGLQVLSQLRSIYGPDRAETILGLFSNIVALRMSPSGDSASVASKSFGQRVVERPMITTNESGIRSSQLQRTEEYLIRPEDLIHAPVSSSGVYGYLLVGGWNKVFQLKWPFPRIEPIAESIVRRPSILSRPASFEDKSRRVSRLRRRSR